MIRFFGCSMNCPSYEKCLYRSNKKKAAHMIIFRGYSYHVAAGLQGRVYGKDTADGKIRILRDMTM